jgi:hypothetical protein
LEPVDAVSLQACRKTGDALGYVDDGKAVNSYTAALPYPLTINMDRVSSFLA